MSKIKLFLDYDNTIVDSISAYCSVYNELHKDHPDFKPANPYLCNKWDLDDVCPLASHDVNAIFSHPLFFKYVEFMNPNTKEVIEKLCEKYEVIIVTIGTVQNIALKSMWLKENLPCIKEYILLVNEGCKMDKSSVNMASEGSIFIDDVLSNIETSNACHKIIFGEKYPWNEDYFCKYLRLVNWTDLEKMLLYKQQI